MKIFVDAHVFDGEYQGSRTYIKELYTRAIVEYPEIDFYFGAADTDNLEEIFSNRSNVHYIRLKSKNKFTRLAFEIPRIISQNNIDYAHFQYIGPLFKNAKWIVSIHDVLFIDNSKYFPLKYRIIKKLLFYISAKRADVLTTISEYSRQAISQHFRIPHDKILEAPCGVGEIYLKKNDKKLAIERIQEIYGLNNYILYVSRIEPRKNHHSLLDAFIELGLDEQGYKIVFVGKESIKNQQLDKMLRGPRGKRIESALIHLEDLPESILADLVLAARLVVYPSYAEGFGIPPLESAVMEVPTICSNLTSLGDFNFFNKNHIEPSTTNIKSRIEAILEGEVDDMKKIRTEIESRYNWSSSAKRIIESLW